MRRKYERRKFNEEVIIKTNGINPVEEEQIKFYKKEELEDLRESMNEMDFLSLAIEDQMAKLRNNERKMDLAIQGLNLMTEVKEEAIAIIEMVLQSEDGRTVIGTLQQNKEVSEMDTYTKRAIITYCHQYIVNKVYLKKGIQKLKELEEEKQSKEAEIKGETPL